MLTTLYGNVVGHFHACIVLFDIARHVCHVITYLPMYIQMLRQMLHVNFGTWLSDMFSPFHLAVARERHMYDVFVTADTQSCVRNVCGGRSWLSVTADLHIAAYLLVTADQCLTRQIASRGPLPLNGNMPSLLRPRRFPRKVDECFREVVRSCSPLATRC